jgi:hypothetical protein
MPFPWENPSAWKGWGVHLQTYLFPLFWVSRFQVDGTKSKNRSTFRLRGKDQRFLPRLTPMIMSSVADQQCQFKEVLWMGDYASLLCSAQYFAGTAQAISWNWRNNIAGRMTIPTMGPEKRWDASRG